MLATSLGNAVSSNFESPGTSSKDLAILRGALFGARSHERGGCAARGRTAPAGSRRRPARPDEEGAGRVLEGELSLQVTADSAT